MIYLGIIVGAIVFIGFLDGLLNKKNINLIIFFCVFMISIGAIIYDMTSPIKLDKVEYYYSHLINDSKYSNIVFTNECTIVKRSYVSRRPLCISNDNIQYVINCSKD